MNYFGDIGLGGIEFVLLPIYAAIIILLANNTVAKHAQDFRYKKYFLKGLYYKLFAAIFYGLIYVYYYKGGDTINYFLGTTPLFELAFSHPGRLIEFIFLENKYPLEATWGALSNGVGFIIEGSASVTVLKVSSIINILGLNSFFLTTLLFGSISYLAHWKVFKLFSGLYPELTNVMAFAFLMIPSVLFWGSGISKDTIVLSCIFFCFSSFIELTILKKRIGFNLFIFGLTAYIISLTRGYVIFALIPSLLVLVAINFKDAFRSAFLRYLLAPVFIGLSLLIAVFVLPKIGGALESYNIDTISKKAEGFKSWHQTVNETQGGSGYTLGEFDYTLAGMLKVAPKALMITLYGPFIWEVKNVVMLLSAIESIALLFFTLRFIYRNGAGNSFSILISNKFTVFSLLFVLIIGVSCGMTSFNYGALVRYKIPILPFYVASLAILNLTTLNQQKTTQVAA